ncbi:hypothetical protein [Mucilaginibacter arboris]|uniref:Uncharacterized protein n=1 Tax=Mucilaginibacter arboris TaxID=2682090 RepID=A0A7K1SVF1_9SPHI|nr:hypothetical protein [Mucilaginibacter arboris]MVN21217.1 hypothetical protein [Mucilaginibacter arboris]
MKTLSFFLLSAVLSVSVSHVFSQSKSNLKIISKPEHSIQVDGNLKDWGDSLNYYNEAKRLHYGFADDKENLYFAIRIENRGQQEQAMRNGITLAFNPEGKKKETYSLTFPSPEQDENSLYVMPKMDNAITEQQLKQENMEEQRKADLLKLRDIEVKGFKDIETDHITTANTYGIKTVLNMDDKGALVYEAAIPIKMLHIDNTNGKPWLFDIKINSFSAAKGSHDGLRPSGEAGGMGGMGGGGMRGGGMNGGGGMRGGGGGMRGGRGGGMGGSQGNYGSSSDQAKTVEIKDKFVW